MAEPALHGDAGSSPIPGWPEASRSLHAPVTPSIVNVVTRVVVSGYAQCPYGRDPHTLPLFS